MITFHIRAAAERDSAEIRTLLEHSGLPTSDLASSQPDFVVASDGAKIIATGALQRFGASALLRSVAVIHELRGAGLGRIIVQELERKARAAGITQLILLTQTAKRFFEQQGYCAVERHHVPLAVHASEEFRVLCPHSAACMAKTLAELS